MTRPSAEAGSSGPEAGQARLPWCLNCHYDLSGLTLRDRAVVCPECGHTNRVAQIRAQLALPPFARDFLLMVAPAIAAAVVAAAAALLGLGPRLMALSVLTAVLCAVAVPPAVMFHRRAKFPLRGLAVADEVLTGIVVSFLAIAVIVLAASAARWG